MDWDFSKASGQGEGVSGPREPRLEDLRPEPAGNPDDAYWASLMGDDPAPAERETRWLDMDGDGRPDTVVTRWPHPDAANSQAGEAALPLEPDVPAGAEEGWENVPDARGDWRHWRPQQGVDGAPAVQAMVLRKLLDTDMEEGALAGTAALGAGTPPAALGDALRARDVAVERRSGADTQTLAHCLFQGGSPIVLLDSDVVREQGCTAAGGALLAGEHAPEFHTLSAAQVVGFARRGNEERVVLNHAGFDGGAAMTMARAAFLDAWQASGNAVLLAYK